MVVVALNMVGVRCKGFWNKLVVVLFGIEELV